MQSTSNLRVIRLFAVGGLVFFIFVLVLEQIFHYVCLILVHPVSNLMRTSPFLYAVYGSLAAGLFEETGRLLAFKTLLKKENDKSTPLIVGLGHGLTEAILITIIPLIVRFGIQGFLDTKGAIIVLFERLCAILIHIALSVFVFIRAKKYNRYFYLLAVLLHAVVDFPVALAQRDVLPLIIVEVYIFIAACVMSLLARLFYNKYLSKSEIEIHQTTQDENQTYR